MVSGLPQEIKDLKHWTNHIRKRPILKPNEWSEGLTYDEVTKAKGFHGYGILVAPHTESPYLFIDVDYPDDTNIIPERGEKTKEQIMQLLGTETYKMGSTQHLKDLAPLFKSIENTELATMVNNTYTEFSPSGTGLRLIVQSCEKHLFNKAYKKSSHFKGQIDFQNQFITITENQLATSPSTILEVSLGDMAKAFNFNRETANDLGCDTADDSFGTLDAFASLADIDDAAVTTKLPSYIEFEKSIFGIPIDQNNKIREAWESLTGKMYEHYDFWLSIGMSIHDYAQKSRQLSKCYLAFLKWSQMDSVSFTSEKAVHDKWISFSEQNKPEQITWRTVMKIYSAIAFEYPRPIIIQGKATKNPLINEWVNFQYLMDYYDLKVYESGGYYIKGDETICQKYFMVNTAKKTVGNLYGPISFDGLVAATTKLCQDSRWRKLTSTSTHVKTWIQQADLSLDLFSLWLDTPFDELPEDMQYRVISKRQKVRLTEYDANSNMQYVFKCLNADCHEGEYDKKELYYAMLKKTLLQIIKFREQIDLEFDGNGGMLILVGAENTYKSTFFKCLMPKAFAHLHKEVNMQVRGEKSVRDFVRSLGTKVIVQIDEFEAIMDQQAQGGLFKNIISGNSSSMTEIYQTVESEVSRKAIIVATTNEKMQQLSDNGSRRMWFIKVDRIDTLGMLEINLHKLYNDLRDEFRNQIDKGNLPWLLNQTEIETLYRLNEGIEAKTDIGLWLEDIWPTAEDMPPNYMNDIKSVQTYKGNKLLNTKDVVNTLRLNGYTGNIKLPALERALIKHCGRWTNSNNKGREIAICNSWLEQGRIHNQIQKNGKYKYKKWVMPPESES